jgi:DNA modification methylase
MICWFGPDPWFTVVRALAEKAGWKTTGLVGIWTKGKEDESGISEANAGQTHMPTKRLANAYEMFYYMWKGDPSLTKAGRSNVFAYAPVTGSKKIHPTERPLELMADVLQTFGKPGDNILVPFAGSGNTLLSAMLCDMKPLGFDLSEGYRDGYLIRVNEIFK